MAGLVIYVSTTTSSADLKKKQTHILDTLSSLKIEHSVEDVSSNREILDRMREILKDEKALAPQICRGDEYIGDYDQFLNAVEDKELESFLKC